MSHFNQKATCPLLHPYKDLISSPGQSVQVSGFSSGPPTSTLSGRRSTREELWEHVDLSASDAAHRRQPRSGEVCPFRSLSKHRT